MTVQLSARLKLCPFKTGFMRGVLVLMRVFMRMRMRLGMFVAGIECVRGHGHHQAPVLHAFQADDEVGKLLHARRLAVDDQHFKAGVVIEMRMARGNDEVVMLRAALRSAFR